MPLLGKLLFSTFSCLAILWSIPSWTPMHIQVKVRILWPNRYIFSYQLDNNRNWQEVSCHFCQTHDKHKLSGLVFSHKASWILRSSHICLELPLNCPHYDADQGLDVLTLENQGWESGNSKTEEEKAPSLISLLSNNNLAFIHEQKCLCVSFGIQAGDDETSSSPNLFWEYRTR